MANDSVQFHLDGGGIPTPPLVGAAFGVGTFGVYSPHQFSNWIPIQTLAANPSRQKLDVKLKRGFKVAVVIDDGTAAVNQPPLNATVVPFFDGPWLYTTTQGRIQVYAPQDQGQVTITET